jgi:hypothetical protein
MGGLVLDDAVATGMPMRIVRLNQRGSSISILSFIFCSPLGGRLLAEHALV